MNNKLSQNTQSLQTCVSGSVIVWEQLKYSTERIVFLMKKNEKINEDLPKYIGKPIYDGMLEVIKSHQKEIDEETKLTLLYIAKI